MESSKLKKNRALAVQTIFFNAICASCFLMHMFARHTSRYLYNFAFHSQAVSLHIMPGQGTLFMPMQL